MTWYRKKKAFVSAASFVLLVGAYAAAGFFGVPHFLRSHLQDFVTEKYNRKVSLGEIHCNPFTLALEVDDFSLPDADGEPLLAFKRLAVNLDIASVWRRAGSFQYIDLDQPYGRMLIRPDGTLNLADLMRPFAQTADEQAAHTEPTRLFIDRLTVRSADLHFEDRTHAAPFIAELRPMSFELLDFSTTGSGGNRYALRAASTSGERFDWSGAFSLAPFASRGNFAVHELQAHTLWSYIRDSVGFEFSRGLVAVSGDYELSSGQSAPIIVLRLSDAKITDLAIRPRDGNTDYVSVTQLDVQNSRVDLAGRRVDIGKLHVNGGELNVWRDAHGRINLLEMARSPAAGIPPAQVSEPKADAAWTLAAPDIAVSGLKVNLADRLVTPAAEFRFDPINVELKDFSTAPGASVKFNANLKMADSGALVARGSASPDTGVMAAEIALDAFDLRSLQPYIDEYTQMNLLAGRLGAKLRIDRTADGVLALNGETTLAKLHTVDQALRQDFVKWDLLRATGIEFRSRPAKLRIANIALRAPYARVIIAADRSVNLTKVMSPSAGAHPVMAAPAPASAAAASSPPQISIGTVRLTNGSANFADFWIQPNYAVSLQELTGTIVGLSSESTSRARMALAGKVDRYAPAKIGGELNLLSASLFTNIKVSFDGVDLTSITPYAGRFAGYKIEKGKLSIDVTYHVENRKLEAQQRFVVNELQLGERVDSPDAVKLPLRLAIALLKDRNGVIDIDLPMTGSLDDPQFRLGPLIWKAFIGLLGKVATAPFALIGNLFGGGPELNIVEFTPGEATLDAAGQQKLAALRKGMQERPALELDVPMAYSTGLDGPAITARKLDAKLLRIAQQRAPRAAAAPDPASLLDPALRLELLAAQFRLELGAKTPMPEAVAGLLNSRGQPRDAAADLSAGIAVLEQSLTTHDPVSDSELSALGQQRAHAVQDALMAEGGIEATRVFVIASSEKPAAKDAKDKVQLELSMK